MDPTDNEEVRTIHLLLGCSACRHGVNGNGNKATVALPDDVRSHSLCEACGKAWWGRVSECLYCGSEKLDLLKGWKYG